MALTDTKIRQARPGPKPVKLTDGRGLYLQVQPSGARLWRYRYRIAGKENVYAVGEYPRVSLADARQAREWARTQVVQGLHPAHVRKIERLAQQHANATTFEAVAREWIAEKEKNWTPYYKRQVERGLEADIFPELGSLPIRQVERNAGLLLEALRKVHKRGAEVVALNLRQWCSAIFRYAVATMRADSDPAAALKGALERPAVVHHGTLSRAEIPAFLAAVDGYSSGYATTRIALRLLLYLFVRPGELRQAEWAEFDLDGAEWRIPAGRMKMRRLHVVPLPRQAVALLRELHSLTGGRPLLFPNLRDPARCMTITTLNRALERMGYAGRLSGHGFRGTASTILHELGYPPLVIERQLAHAPRDKVAAAYNHAEFLPERRAMLQAWADFVDGLREPGQVVPIKRSSA